MNEAKNVIPSQKLARKKFDSATVDRLIDEILLEKREQRAVFTSALATPLGSVSANAISESDAQKRLYTPNTEANGNFTEMLQTYAITAGAAKK